MKISAYLNFPGNCAEALSFYEQHLGAKTLTKLTFEQMPPTNMPPGMRLADVLHARFELGDAVGLPHVFPQFAPKRVWHGKKYMNDLRIELCSRASQNLGLSRADGKRLAIGPVGDHSVQRVGDRENSRS